MPIRNPPSSGARGLARSLVLFCAALAPLLLPPVAAASDEVVLRAGDATRVGAQWTVVPDATAAGGARLQSINANAPKPSAPLASPSSYAELSFVADAGKAYRLWIRGTAEQNSWANDSLFAQFSDSVDATGAPVHRIGTTSGAAVNLEDCSGCGLSGWGWQDNGWGAGVLGPPIYFAATGTHTLRVQVRDDGFGIDQIVLSAATYLTTSPGALKNDNTILWSGGGGTVDEIVLRASAATLTGGAWGVVADATAAGGARLQSPDASAPKPSAPLANPPSHAELTFQADAGKAYRLWLRGKAHNDSWANDSVFVQFSDSVTASGTPTFRIGTTSGAMVNLEDCSGCGLAGWGWQDNGYGTNVLGPLIYFPASGTHTLRIQVREDGFGIDQIVLSAARYLTAAPGSLKNDATILDGGGSPPPPPAGVTLVRGPYLQQVTASSALVVWATQESGAGEVRYRTGTASDASAAAVTTRFAASRTGMASDYYQHVGLLTGLAASSTYEYDILVNGAELTAGSDRFRTAPVTGSGTVRFIAFGDSGVGSAEQEQLAALMGADAFDLALHAGDVAYGTPDGLGGGTHQTLHDWFFETYRDWLRSRPAFPSLGNHDSRSSNLDGRPYLDMFTLPANGRSASYPDHEERYYSFDYGPIHFVALDTELAFQDTARRAAQLSWLESDLAATAQPWKVVYFHRSPFSAGGEHGSDLAVRAAFAPIFERYGVQLAISAHEHIYERTIPWRVGSTGTPVTYIVTGGGGGPLYPAGTAAWTAASASRHHYVRAAADTCVLSLEAVGLNGSVFDAVALNRCTTTAAADVVLYAAQAPVRAGNWQIGADSSAAGGARMQSTNFGAAKVTTASAAPADYFELTFTAEAGRPYRLWIRARAQSDSWANDSVHVQFDRSVNASGTAAYRIGTTASAEVNLEDCSGCGLSGWGWQDNGWGTGVLGPPIYFAATGTQRIRVQIREDGVGIDQIVLSPEKYLTSAPGALKNDTTLIPR